MPISAPKIPDGLPELMRGLAKSVIKENPENLYVHAAEYFENLIRERDGQLEQGYSTFNAYQVYADYKEKNREKLGLTKDPSLSDGNGGDGDESGSAGSESQSRGRRRRRARKPASREKENPVTMVGKPSLIEDGGTEQVQKLNSLSEESAPVSVMEQEIVKVHYSPPEAPPTPARVTSAQSVEAEQAVSSVLDDDQILDSDGTGGKETADELVDNGDDIGTAPSTAEISEQSRAAAIAADPISEMALQDMETCFMHANVDDLLEKRSEDLKVIDDALEAGTDGAEPDIMDEGEDIPEGPQMDGENPNKNDVENETVDKENEKEATVQESNKEFVQESEQGTEITSDPKDGSEDLGTNGDAGTNATDIPEDVVTSLPTVDAVETIAGADQDRPLSAGQVKTEGEDTTDVVSDTKEEIIQNTELFESTEMSDHGNEPTTIPEEENVTVKISTEASNSEVHGGDQEIDNVPSEQVDEPVPVASRMGIEDEEVASEVVTNVNAQESNGGSVADPTEETNAEIGVEHGVAVVAETDNVSATAPEPSNEDAKVELSEDAEKNADNAEENELIQSNNDVQSEEIIQNMPEDDTPTVDDGRQLKSAEDVNDVQVTPLEKDELAESTENENNLPDPNETYLAAEQETKADDLDSTKEDCASTAENDVDKDKEELKDVSNGSQTVHEPTEEVEPAPEAAISDVVQDASDENTKPDTFVEETSAAVPECDNSHPLAEEGTVSSDEAKDAEIQPSEDNANQEDLQSDGVETIEESNAQSGDQEVNKSEHVVDDTGDDLLTKGQSLEDVVTATDGIENDTENLNQSTGGELIAEENIPKNAEATEDSSFPSANATGEDEPLNAENVSPQADEQLADDTIENITASDEVNQGADEAIGPIVDPTFEGVVVDEIMKLLQEDPGNESKLCDENVPESLEKTPVRENSIDQSDAGNEAAAVADDAPECKADGEAVSEHDQAEGMVKTPPDSTLDVNSEMPSDEPKGETSVTEEPPNAPEPTVEDGGSVPLDVSDAVVTTAASSLEEVIEEPCVKREISPSKSVRLERGDSSDKQVEEREEIKKVDLSQLSKDSAEALFYSLKKSELENQEPKDDNGKATVEDTTEGTTDGQENQENAGVDDDDEDVVVKEEPRPAASNDGGTKRTFTDDFLDESPITEVPPTDDGVDEQEGRQMAPSERSSAEAGEQEDAFNPMVMVSMRSKQFQEQLHARETDGAEHSDEPENTTPKRPIMRRCMTEMSGLQRYEVAMDDDMPDPPQCDPAYVEDEDQFDGYYIGHIKNKILASSVSVADSDCGDPTRSSVESVDENNVRTALETIASTDTESTIASQATIQQAGRRSYLRKHSQNTSSNIPYASFGNAAIDQSLDEFIEREERHKQDEAMAEAATKIQRSYRTHKKKLLRDYHSTMRTFTEDQSAESGEEYAANVIQIQLDQKRPDGEPGSAGDGGEDSDSATPASLSHQPLGTVGKRPMYSLNIDEYDTVARRMTLTRGVAMQRNSTPDDDSGKSANASTDRKPSLGGPAAPESPLAASSGSGEVQPAERNSSESSGEPVAAPIATRSSSDEPESKDATHSSSRSKPKSGPALPSGPLPRGNTGRTSFAPLDVQSLLLIARQRTMPVQIDSSVIRVLPKHMRKRISSAGMLNGNGGKRK